MARARDAAGALPELTESPEFRHAAAALSERLGRGEEEIRREAAAGVAEMAAKHGRLPLWAWRRIGARLLRHYDLRTDEAALARLRELDREHTLVWLPSHRSYLDTWVLPQVLDQAGFPPRFGFGGKNLDFWPFGDIARGIGLVFIRRDVQDDPVYRFALRQYLAHLVRARADLGWSIEGGRTRTGKLRPPRYGLLRYLGDAARVSSERSVLLVPMSIVYDQLPEVAAMADEARGARKRPEDVRWLFQFLRRQSRGRGRVYVDFGEPIPLAERLDELAGADDGRGHEVERVALEVCHNINSVTPIVPNAVVTIALLAADRALTLDEIVGVVRTLAGYIGQRGYPVACDGQLEDRSVVAHTLDELVYADAAVRFDGGRETVWAIGPEQHLVAAFQRNSAVHFLVTRAVAEIVVEVASGLDDDERRAAGLPVALALRDLLKFEFFFPRKRDFAAAVEAEIEILDADPGGPRLAPLVLRPFLEAYLVVADCLAATAAGQRVEEAAFLQQCLGVGRQWHLQRRLSSAESVSLELFGTALRMARHRGLDGPGGAGLEDRRQALAAELRETLAVIAAIEDRARDTDSGGADAHPARHAESLAGHE